MPLTLNRPYAIAEETRKRLNEDLREATFDGDYYLLFTELIDEITELKMEICKLKESK